MILIADSGSTSTDWRIAEENGQVHQFRTEGLNPYFKNAEDVEAALKTAWPEAINADGIKEVFFYGSGCSGGEINDIIKNGIARICSKSEINVFNDLVGAARATCGPEPGISAILGTGSNCCYYDGMEIVANSPSLGYVLGDEGSGNQIGRELLRAYFYNEMPEQLRANFDKRFGINRQDVLKALYHEPSPNRYLASYSKFVFQNLKDEFATQLVINCFNSFFEKHVLSFPEAKSVPLHVVGSVGFYYGNLLRRVAESYGVGLGRVIESPIAALTVYHVGE